MDESKRFRLGVLGDDPHAESATEREARLQEDQLQRAEKALAGLPALIEQMSHLPDLKSMKEIAEATRAAADAQHNLNYEFSRSQQLERESIQLQAQERRLNHPPQGTKFVYLSTVGKSAAVLILTFLLGPASTVLLPKMIGWGIVFAGVLQFAAVVGLCLVANQNRQLDESHLDHLAGT